MRPKEQAVRRGAAYLAPVVLASSIPLLTLPIYTRFLSAGDYGAWALSMVYALLVTGVANLGLTFTYERNFYEHRGKASEAALLYSTTGFVAAVLGLCAIATWVFRAPLAAAIAGSSSHAPLFVCTLLAHALMSLKTYYLLYLRNTGQARAHARYSVNELVGATVLGVVFVAWMRLGIIGIPLGQIVASVLVLAALTVRFARDLPLSFSGRLLRAELAMSVPLTPRMLVGVAGSQVDKWVLGAWGTVSAVGIYTVGQRLAQNVFAYMTALENVVTPALYDRMFALGREGKAAVGRYLTPYAYGAIFAALVLGLFAEEAITLLTPPAFYGAIPVAALLCLHYGVMFFAKIPQLVYAKKTGLLSLLTLAGVGANIGLNALLIPRWGAAGTAAGTLIAGTLSAALVVYFGQRHYPVEWRYAALAAMFGILFAGVIAAVWFREAGLAYWPRLGAKALALAAYAAVGVQLGVLSRENIGIARNALRARLVH